VLFHSINASSILARDIFHAPRLAKLAQLVELLFCKQKAVGSIPAFGFSAAGVAYLVKHQFVTLGTVGSSPTIRRFHLLKNAVKQIFKKFLSVRSYLPLNFI